MPRELQASLFDLSSSSGDFPAKTFRWLGSVLDWLEAEAGSGSSSEESLRSSAPAGFLSKTSLACCRAADGGIWEPSSGRWGTWGMGTPTACLTLSGAEFHSGAVVSSLSDVLETCEVPQRYFLSATACRGILRRAEKRGRELPPQLQRALQQGAESIDLGDGEKTT